MPSPTSPPLYSPEWALAHGQRDCRRVFGCTLLDTRVLPVVDHIPGSARIPVEDATQPAELVAARMGTRSQLVVVCDQEPVRARDIAQHLFDRGHDVGWLREGVPPAMIEPGPRKGVLWNPDPYVLDCLPQLPGPSAGGVVDLGGGSGRDGVFLAHHGYDVLSIDRLADAGTLARRRAAELGVTIETLAADLREPGSIPAARKFSVALNVRFLHRPLLIGLAPFMAPNGVLLLSTFGPIDEGQPAHGPTNPQHRLGLGEVRDLLPPPTWNMLRGPALVRERSDPPLTWIRLLARRT